MYLSDLHQLAVECTGDRFVDNWEWKGRLHRDGKCKAHGTEVIT